MIYKHPSLLRAEAIINMVMADQHLVESKDHIIIGAYQNGREQGYKICPPNQNGTIYVAQERRSDDIVVYVGKYSMQGISEDAYMHSRTFGDEFRAVEYIRAMLRGRI